MPAHVEAPFQGFVTPLVRVVDRVEIGDPVEMIEAMKMEATINAPRSCTIVRVAVDGPASVGGGDLVVVMEPAPPGHAAKSTQVSGRQTRRARIGEEVVST